MNLIYLQPTDVLFFRDGRPMGGSLAGHTAAWPLPDVTNHALHAALHRAGLGGVHGHDHHKRDGSRVTDLRRFGSLLTAGPFPVLGGTGNLPVAPGNLPNAPRWFFPRPKDAQLNGSIQVTHQPVCSLAADGNDHPWINSSLPNPLGYAVVNTQPPTKEAGGEPWISQAAFDAYLRGQVFQPNPEDGPHFLRDTDLADTEHQIGIGINPETGTAAESQFYSAHYLRLREAIRLGLIAEAMDKLKGDNADKRDLICALLNGNPKQIIVGGQQRICSAERREVVDALPLPQGLTSGFVEVTHNGRKRWLVKWVLLSPAIWPEISDQSKDGRAMTPHPGGWLPNWVFLDWDSSERKVRDSGRNGEVLLRSRSGKIWRDYSSPKAKRIAENDSPVVARLVAAIVPKPIPVTGWAMPVADSQSAISKPQSEIRAAGAKTTHLAVPAGAAYYFEADSDTDARNLANALNWHGTTDGKAIRNRRSTLMGEKGFGLGVCGTWQFYKDVSGRSGK
ncbi:MAG: type III-B CRISPR module-associated Cmr3 family protein [Verrucomicrobiota bacterium]